MYTGVQWTATLNPNETRTWSTLNWNPASHVVWYITPASMNASAPELQWTVAVERASAAACTYWITVQNLTDAAVTFEGRYAILN
jgi:hypothetical protein